MVFLSKNKMIKRFKKKVAVIGGGIFGSEIALSLDKCGYEVSLFEMNKELLEGASKNNQNRLHLGFHYPRNIETGLQCVKGFQKFNNRYSDAIFKDFKNAYFISNYNSKVTIKEYLTFCKKLNIDFKKIKSTDFPVQILAADNGIVCKEYVYDTSLLKKIIKNKIKDTNINIFLNTKIENVKFIKDENFCIKLSNEELFYADILINTTYSDLNRLTNKLNYPIKKNLYEYTVVPIIELDIPKVGITIMDGPFTSILPYGKTNNFLLYHVDKSVIASEVSYMMNEAWLFKNSSPFSKMKKTKYFSEILNECSKFFPFLKFSKLVGFLEGPRMVLANKDDTDERPSFIQNYDNRYFTVFSGKIDHSVWVSEEINKLINKL